MTGAELLQARWFMDYLHEGVIVLDSGWRYTYVNRRAAELSGKAKEELTGQVVWEVFPEAVGNEFYTQLHCAMAERRHVHIEEYYPQIDRYLEGDAHPCEDGLILLLRDASVPKRNERQSSKRYTQLEALHATAEAVGRAKALEEIYAGTLQGLCRAIGVERVSLLAFDPDGVMRFKAWQGLSDEYRSRVEGHTPWRPGDHAAAPILVPDVERAPELAPFRDVFAREHIRALAFIPLLGQRGVLGKFMLYYAEPHEFAEDEVRIAVTVASHAAFATERDIAEREVRRARRRLQDILDSLTGPFIALDRDWRLTCVSRRVLELSGFKPEELLGRSVWEVFPEMVETAFWPQYHKVMRERVAVQFLVDWKKTGQYFEVQAHPTAEGMSAFVLDVTERKRGQDALGESEERYRFLAEGLPQMVWTVAPDGRTEFLNRHWHGYTGAPEGAGLWESWSSVVHPKDLERSLEGWRAASSAGVEHGAESRIKRATDGAYRWHLVRHKPIKDAGGRVIRWIGTALDIDDRRRAEEALRESERRTQRQFLELDNLYKGAPVGLCVVDTELRYVKINEALAALHGVPVEEHLGRRVSEVLPQIASLLEPLYERVICTREPLAQAEIHVPGAGGAEPRYWLKNMAPLVVDGEVLAVSVVAQDITERKNLETQLRQTQKLEAIGVLAGGVAHDFNNLLTGILGNASLALEMAGGSARIAGMLKQLMTAAERAADLTRQLLAYSGKGQYVVQPLDVSALVREMSSLVRTSIPRSVELELELADGLPAITGDAAQIGQLIMNLVINAAEAIAPEQYGRVEVATGAELLEQERPAAPAGGEPLKPGRYVYIRVRDSGEGMDEATRSRMFDPFFTTKFTGRGLGLAAAQGIVRSHQGAIEVVSERGQGSEFTVWLPTSEAVIPVMESSPGETAVAGSGTILLVDDEEVVRTVARAALERCGYQVVLASNGREAAEIFAARAERIDAVLLDLTMPVMGGVEALHRLRAIRPGVRVLLSSGYSEQEAVRRFESEALDGFIQKPYTSVRLAEKIKQVMEPRGR